jgi:WD40 repeat protein
VWNYDTKEIVMHTTEPLIKGIKNISFSPDGRMLCASAMDEKHCIAVWDWTTSANLKPGERIKPIACGQTSRFPILSLAFNPLETCLVATNVKEVVFYDYK